jgi:hypothetical protein
LTAIRFNPVLKGFQDRLVAAGKPKVRAWVDSKRDLGTIRNTILRSHPVRLGGISRFVP